MNTYNFEGRLRKNFGKDQLIFPGGTLLMDNYAKYDNWSDCFENQIKRFLIKNNIINRNDFDLKHIHKIVDSKYINYNQFDGTCLLGRVFHDTDSEFENNYHMFLKWLHKTILKFDFYFQKTPTIRFYCADSILIGHDKRMPYPRYHCDVEYGHPPQAINLWYTFTKNNQSGFALSNLIDSKKWYSEYDYNFKKFSEDSWNNDENFVKRGQQICKDVVLKDDGLMILFDSRTIHSSTARQDETTRVTMDIRINPVKDFVDGYIGKGRMKAEFKPGGKFGYHKKSISNI
tara:strand:- start:1008 stop:1871 length:864 start_codon:yes stop_codon:yes gene_type:complete